MNRYITFLPHNRKVRAPEGSTILEAAEWAGVSIDSICGGRATCGKCKVRLHYCNTATSEADRRFLSQTELEEGWRLACDAVIGQDWSVEVPPVPATRASISFAFDRDVRLNPNVHKIPFTLTDPSLEDPRPDLERVNDALREKGYEVSAIPSVWRALPKLLRGNGFRGTAVVCGDELIALEPGDTAGTNLGLAVDVGTTTIAAALVDLNTGATLATRSVRNGQIPKGADVIERISYATTHENGLAILNRAVTKSIHELTDELLAACGACRENVYEAIAVGNTTMMHLLLGITPEAIGVAPFVPVLQSPFTIPAATIGLHLHPEARLSSLPHLGAYVGSDAVAGLLATNLLRCADGKRRLYIDIGTNAEIIVSTGERSMCTAAPAGPAFEGGPLQCGMPAREGAIEEVWIDDDVHLRIVADRSRPAGICGSGMVAAVAALLKRGLLDPSGCFVRPDSADLCLPRSLAGRFVVKNGVRAFLLGSPEDDVFLTQTGIRALQCAKAAIASATGLLLARMGLQPADLDEVLLAGAFGSSISTGSARAIGLVPWIPLERIVAVGNAAAAGATIALLSFAERQAANQMPDHIEYLELSGCPEFNDSFEGALVFPTESCDSQWGSARAAAPHKP